MSLIKQFLDSQSYFVQKQIVVCSIFVFIIPFLYSKEPDDTIILLIGLFSIIYHSTEERYIKESVIPIQSAFVRFIFLQCYWLSILMGILCLGSFNLLKDYWHYITLTVIFIIFSEIVMILNNRTKKKRHVIRILFLTIGHILGLGYLSYCTVRYYREEKRFITYLYGSLDI